MIEWESSCVAGGMDLAARLLKDPKMCQSKEACAGLTDIKLLFSYLEIFQVTDKVRLSNILVVLTFTSALFLFLLC